MKKFYINGIEVSEKEANEQIKKNELLFAEMQQGDLSAGLGIKFIAVYNSEKQ